MNYKKSLKILFIIALSLNSAYIFVSAGQRIFLDTPNKLIDITLELIKVLYGLFWQMTIVSFLYINIFVEDELDPIFDFEKKKDEKN